MKKLFILFLISFAFIACNNDDDSQDDQVSLAERLPGSTWNLTTVRYFAVVPNPSNPNQMLPINGNGSEVAGQFSFHSDPDEIDYEITFTAGATLPDGQPVVVPIQWINQGMWNLEENDTKVRVIAQSDTLLFSVVKNTAAEQIWATTVPQFIGEVNDYVDVDIEFTMIR